MFYLGLLLPICFIPGYTGASIPTQWAVLSIALLPTLWRKAALPSLPLYLGLGFVAWAALGAFWAVDRYDLIFGLWCVLIWALSFKLGLTLESPRDLYQGLAVGLSVSSALAIVQWIGYEPIPVFNHNVAGLFYNRTVLGSVTALLILCLISERLWLYIPTLVPSLVLSGSRGGWLILAIGLLTRAHWSLALAAGVGSTAVFAFSPNPSDTLRLDIWSVAWANLNWLGWGANSFINILMIFPGQSAIHPEFVHNDYLQLWFEFGFMALAPIAILLLSLSWKPSPALVAFAALAVFYFPLHVPLCAFLGCFLAGRALRGFSLDGLIIRCCRPDLLSRAGDYPAEFDPAWSEAIPIQSRT